MNTNDQARHEAVRATIDEVDARRHNGNRLVNPGFRYREQCLRQGLVPNPLCTGYVRSEVRLDGDTIQSGWLSVGHKYGTPCEVHGTH
jgi:hypothetical protein